MEAILTEMIKRIDERLNVLLPDPAEQPKELMDAMRYSCLSPGKRIRPILVLASSVAVGGTESDALDAACAVEMVHSFSLIHDDLPSIDNDDLRRGRPTCHVVFGEAVAILAGDALFALAFEVLANSKGSPSHCLEAVKILSQCAGVRGLVSGETIDILSEGKPVSVETLELIHQRKTGSLIAASCELGALFGGGDVSRRANLRSYGEKIGLAFQIADDVLNEIGDASKIGKSVGSDAERGKATYPQLFGLHESKQKALELAEGAIKLVRGVPNEEFLKSLARYSVERLT
jgi:geranylgeranyl diphosphate synthase, type II